MKYFVLNLVYNVFPMFCIDESQIIRHIVYLSILLFPNLINSFGNFCTFHNTMIY